MRSKLRYQFDLLRELVLRDLRLRYKRSLGVFWSLLNPLLQLLVFTLIFGIVLPLKIPNFPLFLFVGLLAWNWFQASLTEATGAIVDNRDLVRRPGFSTTILPVVPVTTNFIRSPDRAARPAGIPGGGRRAAHTVCIHVRPDLPCSSWSPSAWPTSWPR